MKATVAEACNVAELMARSYGTTLFLPPTDKLAELREPKSKFTHIAYQRMDYLLEQAPSTKVLDFLKGRYPDVEFTPHPTMNGFYARGSGQRASGGSPLTTWGFCPFGLPVWLRWPATVFRTML